MTDAPRTAGAPRPLSRRAALTLAGASLALGTLMTVLFVLPFEFGVDPTGLGRATGLLRAPQAPTADAPTAPDNPVEAVWTTDAPFRSDLVEIPLSSPDAGPNGYELEYKVRMREGARMVWSMTVAGVDDPEEFYFDFHGETPAGPNNPKPIVREYIQQSGTQSHGALVAPIPGVHGWYLQNQSGKSALVRLRLSGFYELVEPGEYGNLARIRPSESRP
ncbi:hypothetical protein NK718_00100 [Alsobacter sp. SYSU M60028]|uniref:DUF1214 domain-containing protein n=1 Tax=Alsobacter ponti TaxID=2962936 RepID=A0ABT1L6A3_9HYPH|nr:hypothetical protein [Alsobacter ponti]MCP8936904.1 hypothetical protein [Alsobacter ponti]